MSFEAALGAQTLALSWGLVSNLRVIRTIGQAHDRLRAAIPELGGGRIAQGPAAHGLAQLHDRHPLGQRHDDLLLTASLFELLCWHEGLLSGARLFRLFCRLCA